MKSPLWRFIFKPVPVKVDSIEDGENLRKQIMLHALSLLGMVFLVLMSIRLFFERLYFYALLDIGFASFLLVLFFLVRTEKN